MANRNTRITGSQILEGDITEAHLNASVAGAGLAGGAGSPLSVNVDNVGLEIPVDTLQIKDSGVTEPKLNIFNSPTVGNYLGYTSNGMEWSSVTLSGDVVMEADLVMNELANETPNHVIVAFTHDFAAAGDAVQLYLNGLLQQPGVGKDYTYVSGTKTATFADAPKNNDIVLFCYVKDN
jgi:hypothetical protein